MADLSVVWLGKEEAGGLRGGQHAMQAGVSVPGVAIRLARPRQQGGGPPAIAKRQEEEGGVKSGYLD